MRHTASRILACSFALTLLLGSGTDLLAQAAATAAPPAAPATAAATLSAQDRAKAIDYLNKTRQDFLASIAGLSEAQWKFKAAPDRWSIAEVAEHITISEETILGLVTDRILKAPPAPAGGETVTDEKVIQTLTDRSSKVQAPEMLKPVGKWANQAELTQTFEQRRAKTLDYVKTTQDDLRGHAGPHPLLGTIDGYQWVLLLAAHSARHTAQIEEVKTAPGYPKS
ncbi:MAG TPA: DinB family protein [Thermoanaerobaculia bacterium]|nr:DinB family protein [Thermoanaerobaculia bacterium]